MRKWWLLVVFLVFLFQWYPNSIGFAAENDSHNMPGMDMSQHDSLNGVSGDEHAKTDPLPPSGNTEAANAHQQHEKENVVETPPNFIVLSIFALVNLGFILFGAWHKWWRREGQTA